jgi:hypothetical protein
MLQQASPEFSLRQRMLNLGLLIGGFGLGQGAIFAVQTWLMAKGKFDLLAAFGTHYSFAVLAIMMVDAGSSTVLTRVVIHRAEDQGPNDDVWRIFWETGAFRAVIALLIGIGIATYAWGISSDGFSRSYIVCALPGLFFWAGNPVGLLDGLRLSGISGITGSIAYASSAIGLAIASHAPTEMAGSILGGAFSLGYFLTIATQWAVLAGRGWRPKLQKTTQDGLLRSTRDGIALLLQSLPGQLALRVQLALSAAFLGPESTALFVYVKQAVAAMAMIIAFVLRVDFPMLVQTTSRAKTHSIWSIFHAQITTLYCAIALTVGTLILCIIILLFPHYGFGKAAALLIPFSITILTGSATIIMVQGLAALGAYALIAKIIATGAAIAIVISCLFVTILDVYAFLAAELACHSIWGYLVYRQLRHLDRNPAAWTDPINKMKSQSTCQTT